jgi:alcohol dehydrogenase (NADP+)
MLHIHGRFVTVGPLDEPLPRFNAMPLLGNGALLGGPHIGCEKECIQMPQFAVDKGMEPWITLLSMSDVKSAVEAVKKNDVKGNYWLVLT